MSRMSIRGWLFGRCPYCGTPARRHARRGPCDERQFQESLLRARFGR